MRLAAATREVTRTSRLAAGLRLYPNPEAAAKFAGVEVDGLDVAELARRARAEHPSLDAGNLRDTAALAETAVHLTLLELVERRAELPARDLVFFARFALEAAQALRGDGPQVNYVGISLGIVPPPADGKLTPEQRAKVQGRSEGHA